jgi:SNF2 family DNA or RNA helicase
VLTLLRSESDEQSEGDGGMSSGARAEDVEERDELAAEADMDIEELLKKYGLNQGALKKSDADGSEDDDENEEEEDEMADAPTPRSVSGTPRSVDRDSTDAAGAEAKLEDERLQAIAASARAFAPTGHTLKTTEVKTKIPEILRANLREYQHVALDWLVSLSDKRLNGILADEMGLGKTLMTISLLAHHACENGNWGPHLIVVPTSVMLNWEIEIKKFCPAFKVLTYYGSMKERRKKRQGWSKPNSFHICITSYKLVVQDANMFRRKKWRYLILDEAHNIKNFSSQRWQILLNFRTKRRLLLTGTPIQNNLMELWSLLHFLMPHIFGNHDEFKEWFSKPLTHMVEGAQVMNMELINRLHTVLRPFILRRLKKDVESQMPSKYEHVVPCRLSKRQRFLYDEFMLAGTTRAKLASGNLLEIINVLMQLRKVCNHPDLFEERPIYSPVEMGSLVLTYPKIAFGLTQDRIEASLCSFMLAPLQCLNARQVELSAFPGTAAPAYPVLSAPVALPLLVNPLAFIADDLSFKDLTWKNERRQMIHYVNRLRAPGGKAVAPCYGSDLRAAVTVPSKQAFYHHSPGLPRSWEFSSILNEMVVSPLARLEQMMDIARVFCAIHAKVRAKDPVVLRVQTCTPAIAFSDVQIASAVRVAVSAASMALQPAIIRSQLHFPDKRLLQYDCGKLQTLAALLRQLKDGGHRVLIFTQMSKVLNILEEFLSFHHHAYVRLDGTTKIEKRQQIVERFNKDLRLFVFISSTRSGGLGINLTGADTVIFYDSDWNPAMDKQAQDRCHRIGQTRDVHIYRLVSEHTVEENILKKATQKQHLDTIVMSDGLFTEASLAKVDVRDFFAPEVFEDLPVASRRTSSGGAAASTPAILIDGPISARDWEAATSHAEDTADVAALASAKREVQIDEEDFAEATSLKEPLSRVDSGMVLESSASAAPTKSPRVNFQDEEADTPIAKFDQELMHMLKPVQRLALLSLERARDPASTAGGSDRMLEDARVEAELNEWRTEQIALYRDADAQLAADEAYLKLNGNTQYFHEAPSGNSLAVYTRHTSHVTRHTSHVTRHTSHVTRHTSQVIPLLYIGSSLRDSDWWAYLTTFRRYMALQSQKTTPWTALFLLSLISAAKVCWKHRFPAK